VADLFLKALDAERRLWAECRLKGLGKGTPERLRIEEPERLLKEHRTKPGAEQIEVPIPSDWLRVARISVC
jgi:hypothetical protein